MSSAKQRAKVEKFHKKREEGFDLGSVPHAKLKSYSALHDPNMRHYFENPNVQRLLYNTGQIDSNGRVINLHKNKTKLHILEREFKEAEIAEMRKLKEEEEMRHRVQRKRFQQLEEIQRQDMMARLKSDRTLSKQILGTIKASTKTTLSPMNSRRGSPGGSKGTNFGNSTNDSMFFVTEGDGSLSR